MLLLPIVDQLKAIQTAGKPEFRKVSGAANFAAASDDLKGGFPVAYVIPLRDNAGASQIEGAVLQQVKEQFGVMLVVSNLRDAKGEAAQAEFERLRKLVISSLLGFFPGTDYDPVEYVGGAILKIDAQTLWWQLTFTTGYMERNF